MNQSMSQFTPQSTPHATPHSKALLSRVADALFWMNRYLERAEHIARLVDVGFHLELDLHGLFSRYGLQLETERHWFKSKVLTARKLS